MAKGDATVGNEKTTGPGSISIEGLGTLSGADAKKTSAEGSTWVSEDGRQSYSVVQMGSRQDLIISVNGTGAGSSGRITVRGWANGQLGISLGEETAQEPQGSFLRGDFVKATETRMVDGEPKEYYVLNGVDAFRSAFDPLQTADGETQLAQPCLDIIDAAGQRLAANEAPFSMRGLA